VLKGRAFKFGDGISTDHIIPGRYAHLRSNLPELAKHVLEDADATFASRVEPGDFIVGGNNFGLGSSREHAPLVIKMAGVSAVLVKSVARIFFRNAVNQGLPVLICDTDKINDGDELEVDLAGGTVKDITSGNQLTFSSIPEVMLRILIIEDKKMVYSVTLIEGDGIGPEVTEATRRVLEATGVSFRWDLAYAGQHVMDTFGTTLLDHVLRSIRENGLALKGPITTPVGSGFRSVNVTLRKKLGLYANVRPFRTYPGVPSPYKDIDIVVVRENTEDLYSGIEFERGTPAAARLIKLVAKTDGSMLGTDAGFSLKVISEAGSRRIVKFAFEYARKYGRKKVTATHKANIMKFSDGLFLSVAQEVAEEYADIEFEDRIVDNLAMQLVKTPQQFDVIVAPNLYGDILSDLCAGLVGGLGVAPGANIGDNIAVFEPVHGSAPKYAGQNRSNPMAMMLSGAMMLHYLEETKAADRLEGAIAAVIAEGRNVTYDMKPGAAGDQVAGTSQVADAVIEKLEESANAT